MLNAGAPREGNPRAMATLWRGIDLFSCFERALTVCVKQMAPAGWNAKQKTAPKQQHGWKTNPCFECIRVEFYFLANHSTTPMLERVRVREGKDFTRLRTLAALEWRKNGLL